MPTRRSHGKTSTSTRRSAKRTAGTAPRPRAVRPAPIYIVSDGRGETCAQYLKAALVQFEEQHYRITRWPAVRTPVKVREIVETARRARAVVFYTLAGGRTRSAMQTAARRKLVPTVDVLGPAFAALHDVFHRAPRFEPGLLYASDRERFDRQEAIDFTLRHDDGHRTHELARADVVLVGVSRSAKSSTCFYLAYEGIRAANVPLIPGVPPPAQLLRLSREKVVGLQINVMRLLGVREARVRTSLSPGAAPESYTDRRAVVREIMYANGLMERRGWRAIDVSYMAVEEIARAVIQLRGLDD